MISAALFALAACLSVAEAQFPKFCNGVECPLFTSLVKNGSFEIRQYPETHWVGSSTNGTSVDAGTSKQFMKMFHYISGENAAGKKIKMTAPVLETVEAGDSPTCTSRFNTSFFLPPHDLPAPQPNDASVFLHSLPAAKVAVTSYGGYTTDAKFQAHLQALGQWVVGQGLAVRGNGKLSAYAGYSSPFQFFGRHNEVWLWLE